MIMLIIFIVYRMVNFEFADKRVISNVRKSIYYILIQ